MGRPPISGKPQVVPRNHQEPWHVVGNPALLGIYAKFQGWLIHMDQPVAMKPPLALPSLIRGNLNPPIAHSSQACQVLLAKQRSSTMGEHHRQTDDTSEHFMGETVGLFQLLPGERSLANLSDVSGIGAATLP